MKQHALIGRKQSPEHIRKRIEAVAKKRASWSLEQHESFAKKISEAIKNRPKEMQEKFMYCHVGKPAWNKGMKCPQWSGENHWNYGNNMPQESIEKMRQSLTGKKQSAETIRKRFVWQEGYRHSPETKAKIGMANKGENNGMWEGGISYEPYPPDWNTTHKEKIRERDGRTCRLCGVKENGKHHDCHHVDYDKKNISPSNLLTLCHVCHGKTNYRRDEWMSFFRGPQQSLPT
jgi:hypothetical protein